MMKILLKTCRIDVKTVIDTEDVFFEKSDENLNEIYADSNHNINFLPKNIYEKYPNLISMSIWYCSLESVSKDSFQRLTMLRRLALNYNQLKVIKTDTFEDLVNLEWLFLDNNKIVDVDGQAFVTLANLKILSLNNNICINAIYRTEEGIKSVTISVTDICSRFLTLPKCQVFVQKERDKGILLQKGVKQKLESCSKRQK